MNPSIPSRKINFDKIIIILFFLVNLGVIFVLWWMKSSFYILNPSGGNIYTALGRITGLLASYLLLVQLILIGRIRWFESAFGFDKLNKIHRFIGYGVMVFLLSHPIFLIIGKAKQQEVSLYSQFGDYLANWPDVFAAFVAVALFIFIVFLSISVARKSFRYETWYLVHLLTYLAIGLAFSHQFTGADIKAGWPMYYWYVINFAVFGSVLLYRFLRPIYLFMVHRFVIDSIVKETHDTWSIIITGRKMESFKFASGQYANLTIFTSGMRFSHPFSFSSAYNGKYVRFTVKNLGDYTAKIQLLKPGTHIVLDGPLGLFIQRKAIRELFLFIAGGIGVTPARAMLESLAHEGRNAVLLYSSRTEADIAFKNEFDQIKQMNPLISVHHIVSTPTPGYESGFIDKEKIVRLVPDFYLREVYLCGPPPMMNAMVANLKELGFDDNHIHFENFSF